jgi:hypothetical protein
MDKSKSPPQDERAERLAQALRANLRRRKAVTSAPGKVAENDKGS